MQYTVTSSNNLDKTFHFVSVFRSRKSLKSGLLYHWDQDRPERVDMGALGEAFLSAAHFYPLTDVYFSYAFREITDGPHVFLYSADTVYTYRKSRKRLTIKFAAHMAWSLPRG